MGGLHLGATCRASVTPALSSSSLRSSFVLSSSAKYRGNVVWALSKLGSPNRIKVGSHGATITYDLTKPISTSEIPQLDIVE